MASHRHRRVEDLFHRALSVAPADIPGLLERECADDSDLRAEVEKILASDRRTAPFFTEIRSDLDEAARDAGGAAPGAILGPYTLLEKLGEGGSGEVYVADQTRPVKRRVALKILKAGMDTKAVLARFDAERQALAQMDHPGITRVFDAGETDRGRPFFVMELVKGETITAWCDRRRLTIGDRLELFEAVCQAVQHAHQKGVVHRDLKPSNILVTLVDGAPVPKVIDFGIAKATSASLSESTLYTEQGQFVGTPEYMSPEQTGTHGTDVDTRADVYSLGVVLYELLSGSLPFDSRAMRAGGVVEIQRLIQDVDPPRPSSRLGALGTGADEAAANRGTSARQLERRLSRDLDWIVLRAIEKDRTRRYETANALAEDIRRFRKEEPVLAGPPSAAYRLSKFVKRNRAALAVVGMIIGSLSYALVESNRQRLAAEEARIESDRQRAAAESARDDAEAVTTFLSDMLAAADPGEKGRDVTVREVLDQATRTIADDLADQPLIRARLFETIGVVYRELGNYGEARPLLENALELRREILGEVHADVASSLEELGSLLLVRGDYEAARPLYERALALHAVLTPDGEELATSLNDLGHLLSRTGEHEGARRHYERALVIYEENLGPEHRSVSLVLNNLAVVLQKIGDHEAARRHFERALTIQEKTLGEDHPDLALLLGNLGLLVSRSGDEKAALPLLRRSLRIFEETLGPEHARVGMMMGNLGGSLRKIAEYDEALEMYGRSISVTEKALGPEHPAVGASLIGMAHLQRDIGDYGLARTYYERALRLYEAAYGSKHRRLASALHGLADLHQEAGEYDSALPLYLRALSMREEVLGPHHAEVASTLHRMAILYTRLERPEEARPLLERAVEIRTNALGADHALVVAATEDLETLGGS